MIKRLAKDSVYYSFECTKCNDFLPTRKCYKCGEEFKEDLK